MMLKKSPRSHTTMKTTDRPSAEPLFQFSMIWGEKTTKTWVSRGGFESWHEFVDKIGSWNIPIQHAMLIEPKI